MANSTSTTRDKSPKVSRKSAAAFMCKLFDPLPDAELDDRELARLEKRARKQAWERSYYRVRAAEALRNYVCYTKYAEAREGEEMDYTLIHETNDRRLAEYRRQILVPAPHAAALKWKKGLLKIAGITARHYEAIARDEAALARPKGV